MRLILLCFRSHITEQGPLPDIHIGALADVAVEVAIRAFREAERPVDVEGFGQGALSLKIKAASV